MSDFSHILRRERGRREAEDFLSLHLRQASAELARSAYDLSWWREEGSPYQHWLTDYTLNHLWQHLAIGGMSLPRQPRRFHTPWTGMQLALLYAQEHYPQSLHPLELTREQRQQLIWTRRVLTKLAGVGTTFQANAVVYDKRCTPLRNWPDVRGYITLGCFFGGDRLPWNTIVNIAELNKPDRVWGRNKLVLTVLHEETHHGFWRVHRNQYTVRLADYVEESVVRLLEETARLALDYDRLPTLEEVEAHVRRKKFEYMDWILWMCQGRGGLAGTLQRARRLSIEACRKSREGDVALLLNTAAGGRKPAYAWRRLLRY